MSREEASGSGRCVFPQRFSAATTVAKGFMDQKLEHRNVRGSDLNIGDNDRSLSDVVRVRSQAIVVRRES